MNSLGAPKSADVHEALLGGIITSVILKLCSCSRRRLRLTMTQNITILFISEGRPGAFVTWNCPESYRLMARRCQEEEGLEKYSSDLQRWGSTFSLITVKSNSAMKAAGLRMSCFPGVIYLFDVMSLINCSNHDSPWLNQVYSDVHHCLLEQLKAKALNLCQGL